jgi:hypothetical protein
MFWPVSKAIASASALPVQPKDHLRRQFWYQLPSGSHLKLSIISVRVFMVSVLDHGPPFLRQLSQALLPPGRPFAVIQQKQSRSKQAQPAQDRKGPPDTDRIYQILQK